MQKTTAFDEVYRLGVPAIALGLLVLSVLQAFQMFSVDASLIMRNGIAVGSDFLSLWSAAWLAITGNAAGAYDPETIRAAHTLAVPANTALTLWHYPPTFQLLLAPFGLIPYLPAYVLFISTTALLYLHLLWKLRPAPSTLLLGVSFTSFWVNILAGQNGFLTSILIGWALLLHASRPLWSGVFIGVLTFKPQLGLPIPLALLAGRQFKIFIAALIAAAALALLSVLAFGYAPWQAFFANLSHPLANLEAGKIPMTHMASVFSALWITGLPPLYCYAVQALVAVSATLLLVLVWRKNTAAFEVKAALLVLAMLLTTPHLFNYDLPLLGLPLVWLWAHGEKTGWLTGERPLLLLVWLAPLLLTPNEESSTINLLPLAPLALFALALRRTRL